MIQKLKDKVAVVTGGSTGIGLGIARRFAQEGARVFITGRRKAELDVAAAAIGPMATAVQADSAKLSDLDRLYDQVKAEAGRIDVLVANAGGGDQGGDPQFRADPDPGAERSRHPRQRP